MAVVVVGLMALTGFAVLGQVVLKTPAVVPTPIPASASAIGPREATYTIDHMFELYQKSHNPADLGRWNMTMGLNEWWTYRESIYYEYQLRSTFPFILNYNPYSTKTTPDVDQGGSITTWYRLTADATNLTNMGLGPSKDPIFTPVIGPASGGAGAWMNITWYGTYLETWELTNMQLGTHYANTYYKVPRGATPRPATDDGYYHELQGKLQFNRAAAAKVLGLGAAGDLRPQFNASDATITSAWITDWLTEGGQGPTGIYDTYTAYDYSLAIQYLELSVDPASTQDNLILRFWSVSWGNECLLIRYMEAANVFKYWQGWQDDWYLNITIGPDAGWVHSRGVVGYHMYATKDYLNNINGWALEASHMDWCGNAGAHTGYSSPYTKYDPASTNVLHTSTAPLTKNFGVGVSYILAPLHWNLTSTEKIIVKLPSSSTSVPGYWPQTSAFDIMDNPVAKKAEMNSSATWGELVAGNGYPNTGTQDLRRSYSAVTKTYTLKGPMSIPVNWNPSYSGILNYGAPMFVMNVVTPFTLNLVQGWNLVTAPPANFGYKASTLGLSSGDQVVMFDPATQQYKTYVVGFPLNDFVIAPSTGYWIFAATAKTIKLNGEIPRDVQSRSITVPSTGWAIIGLNSLKNTLKASNIAAMYSAGVTQVIKWDAVNQKYITYVVGFPLNNFTVVPGEGYWIFCSASGTFSYTP